MNTAKTIDNQIAAQIEQRTNVRVFFTDRKFPIPFSIYEQRHGVFLQFDNGVSTPITQSEIEDLKKSIVDDREFNTDMMSIYTSESMMDFLEKYFRVDRYSKEIFARN